MKKRRDKEYFTLSPEIRIEFLKHIEDKISKGKFYPDDIDLNIQSTEFGDPENVHTIAGMYAQYVIGLDYDVAMSEIEDAIIERYPWCVV